MTTEIATPKTSDDKEVATLAGGCFWCLEAVFDEMNGVESVESGYIGGPNPHPTYEQVCGGQSGHAEAVQITYDPQAVSFQELLAVFFSIHDPTTVDRQGNDVGTQYRSSIFYHSPEQKAVAEELIAELTEKKAFPAPIVTRLERASDFYTAESYHQEYFSRNPTQAYCTYVVSPKIAKFRKYFAEKVKK